MEILRSSTNSCDVMSTALTGMVIQEGAILNGGFCFVCSTEEMREF